jgi:hypothetical protein
VQPLIEDEEKNSNATNFNRIGENFGELAHRVFLALDIPSRSIENFHSKTSNRVLLDPYTVLNRARSLKADDSFIIDSVEFWKHGDVIKTLVDFLSIKYPNMEATIGST